MRGTPMNVEAFKRRLPIRLRQLLEQQEAQLRAKTQQQIGQIGGGIVDGFIPQQLGQGIAGQQQAGWKARRRVQMFRQRKWK
jgi:outer membrane lipoprotein SlyB